MLYDNWEFIRIEWDKTSESQVEARGINQIS